MLCVVGQQILPGGRRTSGTLAFPVAVWVQDGVPTLDQASCGAVLRLLYPVFTIPFIVRGSRAV